MCPAATVLQAREIDRLEMTRAIDSLHAQLAAMREEMDQTKGEHERDTVALIAQVREGRETGSE